ncbi:MAG TPA: hypothetical protein VLA24_03645 [Pseudomonadales bacterium]|nr:hypothetical protein [Pseudomonadales bacterium]
MNYENIELNALCSRKLLDMYKSSQTTTVKNAIADELMRREHFINAVETSPQQHH